MDKRWLHAYVDETGTNELDVSKPGVSVYFICVAFLVEGEKADEVIGQIDQVTQDLSGGAEIKSSSIGGNHKRRKRFLDAVANVEFGYYAMLVRKDAIRKDSGFRFKSSFYKCINQMLYRRLTRSGRSVKIFADEVGGKDFMESFDAYLSRNLKPDLFFSYEHQFVNSNENRLVQLADLIAGTLGQCFEPEKRGPHSEEFRTALRSRELAIDIWPDRYEPIGGSDTESVQADDLTDSLLARVNRFLAEREDSNDPIEVMRVMVLRSLLFAREFEEGNCQLISSDRLIDQLQDQGFDEISKREFTKDVIGGIRIQGVIVAGTQKGYRLALTKGDIEKYLDHNKRVIEPMLVRLREARKAVKLDTANAVDILDSKKYRLLSKFAECVNENALVDGEEQEAP